MANIVCRACLISNVKMHQISTSLQELYEKLTNEKLIQNDGPHTLCFICYALFEKSYKFIKMAQESSRMLLQNAGDIMPLNPDLPIKLSTSKVSHTTVSEVLMPISKVEIKMEPHIDTDDKHTYDLTNDKTLSLIDTKNDDSDSDITKNDIIMIVNDNDIKEDLSSDDEPLIKVKKRRRSHRVKYEGTSKKRKLTKKPIAIYISKDLSDFDVKKETDNTKKQPGPKVLCHICKREISKVGFRTHLRIHAGEKIYSCSQCDYKCVRKYSLDVHSRSHSGQKPYACELCQYKCSIKKNLQRHLLVHSGVKPFSCNICGQMFTQKVSLDSHNLRIHTSENPYPCDVCGHRFVRKQDLEKHKLVHIYGRRPRKTILTTNFPKIQNKTDQQYLCHICDYVCKQKSALKTHLMSHTGEKPYSCDKCDFKTTSKPTLKTHMRRHTGEKPYLCHYCDYRCAQKSNLNNHIRIHTGEKAYACDMCDYRSTQLPHLKQHKKIHTGEKSFVCVLCNYKCSYKQRLQKHIMSVHRREAKQELNSQT